jgi:Ca-activated chloride channel family protein
MPAAPITINPRSWALRLALVTLVLGSASPAMQVEMQVDLSHPLLPAAQQETIFVKVSLTGFALTSTQDRTPVNLALVIDRSGSMSGEKIEKARIAAIDALRRLDSRDIVSIVSYESAVSLDYPATRLTDREPLVAAVRRLQPGGNTALFGGVSKGAAEVRKFLSPDRVNRIILLSDGLANVGPSTPGELGALGESLRREGVNVSTIGLGRDFNSDLMTQLARRGGGNHDFVETPEDLGRIFRFEFGDALSVVAQEVVVKIRTAPGFRPIRVLGREADISGDTVTCLLSQLYSQQEKYVLLELEAPAREVGSTSQVAQVDVSYANMLTHSTDRLTSSLSATHVASPEKVLHRRNPAVMVEAIKQISNDANEQAILLRDAGQLEEARDALLQNGAFLQENGEKFESQVLLQYADRNYADAENILNEDWRRYKKQMQYENYKEREQQKR